ncbi:40S ribosomal protein S3a-like protein [Tanacetum coccineum]
MNCATRFFTKLKTSADTATGLYPHIPWITCKQKDAPANVISLADLQNDKDHSYRMIHLRAEDVQGKNVLTNFWGMDFTTDKLRCSALASQRRGPTRSRGPAMLNLAKSVREIMVNQAQFCDLEKLVQKFILESIGREIEKSTSSIYPLQNNWATVAQYVQDTLKHYPRLRLTAEWFLEVFPVLKWDKGKAVEFLLE